MIKMTRAVIFIEKLTNFYLNNPIFYLKNQNSTNIDFDNKNFASFWLILTLQPKIDLKNHSFTVLYLFYSQKIAINYIFIEKPTNFDLNNAIFYLNKPKLDKYRLKEQKFRLILTNFDL